VVFKTETMRTSFVFISILSLIMTVIACDKKDDVVDPAPVNNELIITDNVLSCDFVGNGAQWGGYDMVPTWLGTESLSDEDWNKLYERIDFMRPPFLRIMTTPGWSYSNNGTYDVDFKTTSLFKMLDYAQSRDIEISYGEWGHQYINTIENVDLEWIANSVRFLDYLVNTKGYSCIKTVNIINEPNGYWSTTDGNYTAWKNVQEAYVAEMANYNLSDIKLMGPDVAIFNSVADMTWITNAKTDLDENIGLYDIHVYPKQLIVRNGDYTDILKAYRDAIPDNKRIVLGEIGFKYDEVDADLQAQNEAAIAADPFAGDDSQMMIYNAFYGIDMADALIQSMRAGFSGALIWDMDDAMYNSPDNGNYQTDKLKRWGFWNILGEEHCGDADDEEIRPFFYTVSLLCRYFPAGANIYNVELPDKKGVRAIMAEKDGKYSIAIVNSHLVSYDLQLKSDFIPTTPMNTYRFKSENDSNFIGEVDENGFAVPEKQNVSCDFSSGVDFSLEAQSFVLYTNMN
jgi:hypothetical protein